MGRCVWFAQPAGTFFFSTQRLWLVHSPIFGVIVVSPAWVAGCPSIVEVCIRKAGARRDADGCFRSGTIRHVEDMLEQLPAQVVYLLPFFKP